MDEHVDPNGVAMVGRSQTIGKLAAALCKAQRDMKGAKRDSSNPFFKSKYADLSAVWDACRAPLTSNGLCVIQTTEPAVNGTPMVLVTTLAHESGEWIDSRLQVVPVKDDPQGTGSAITYARRYALAAIAGVAPEDDDGEAAMGRKEPEPKKAPKEKPEPALPAGQGLTDEDIERVAALSKKAGYQKHGDLKPILQTIGGVDSLRMLERRYLDDLVAHLESKAGEAAGA